jgi:hypothetical protein
MNFIINSSNNLIKFIRRHELISLLCLAFLVYNLNCRTIGSGDTIPATLLPFSILNNQNLYFDNFYPYYSSNSPIIWYFIEMRGHILSQYPIVTPVLITPLYAIPVIFLKINQYPLDMSYPGFALIVDIMEKLSASLITSISVVFVFLSLKLLSNEKTAVVVALIFAFATSTWSTSSQGLWQQGLVELLLAMSIYLVFMNQKQESTKIVILLGVLSGLFIFNRPADSLLLLMPVAYYIFSFKDKKSIYYVAALIVSSAPFLYYNLHYFGNVFGGYGTFVNGFDISSQIITRLMGLIFSPSRGLLIYTPVMLLSISGAFKISQIKDHRIREFILILGLSIVAQTLVYGAFTVWWAGGSYGPRFLAGMLPGLSIFMGLFIEDLHFDIKNRTSKSLFIIFIISLMLIWSVFVQFVGAFYYPNGNWNGDPNVDYHPERLWDWNDTQITRTFCAGMIPPSGVKGILKLINIITIKDKDIARETLQSGWNGIEIWNGIPTRWMQSNAAVLVQSQSNSTAALTLQAQSFHRQRTLEIRSGNYLTSIAVPSTGFVNFTAPISLKEGENTIILRVPEGCERPCDIKELNSADTRCLSVAVQNVRIRGN